MIRATCVKCGTQYPSQYVEQWGQNGVGDAYGPQAVCTALVPDKRTKADQVCRGSLLYGDRGNAADIRASMAKARFSRGFKLDMRASDDDPALWHAVNPESEETLTEGVK